MENPTNPTMENQKTTKKELIMANGLFTALGFYDFMRRRFPDFVVDDHNKKVVRKIYDYYSKNPDFEKDGSSLNKGLCLIGSVGTGKSELILILNMAYKETMPGLVYAKKTSFQITEEFKDKDGGDRVFSRHQKGHLWLDEIGLKKERVRHFGDESINTTEMMILKRYEVFRYGLVTHFTSNLTIPEMEEWYDTEGRTVSRLRQMCNIIVVDGPDRRHTHKGYAVQNLSPQIPGVSFQLTEEQKQNRDFHISELKKNFPSVRDISPDNDPILSDPNYIKFKQEWAASHTQNLQNNDCNGNGNGNENGQND